MRLEGRKARQCNALKGLRWALFSKETRRHLFVSNLQGTTNGLEQFLLPITVFQLHPCLPEVNHLNLVPNLHVNPTKLKLQAMFDVSLIRTLNQWNRECDRIKVKINLHQLRFDSFCALLGFRSSFFLCVGRGFPCFDCVLLADRVIVHPCHHRSNKRATNLDIEPIERCFHDGGFVWLRLRLQCCLYIQQHAFMSCCAFAQLHIITGCGLLSHCQYIVALDVVLTWSATQHLNIR